MSNDVEVDILEALGGWTKKPLVEIAERAPTVKANDL
jgi:hypothetical protein